MNMKRESEVRHLSIRQVGDHFASGPQIKQKDLIFYSPLPMRQLKKERKKQARMRPSWL